MAEQLHQAVAGDGKKLLDEVTGAMPLAPVWFHYSDAAQVLGNEEVVRSHEGHGFICTKAGRGGGMLPMILPTWQFVGRAAESTTADHRRLPDRRYLLP